MKKIFVLLLTVSLLIALASPAFAKKAPSPKEESVFGLLNTDGTVNNIYVVNSLEGGDVLDFGTYSSIINMTDSIPLTQDGEKITTATLEDRLFYQGTLKSKDLPWNISVKYYLNGKQETGKAISGKSGDVEVAVSIKSNKSVNRAFFDNYVLQVTFTLDTNICKEITSDGATIANAGTDKIITHTVMPGKGAEIRLKTKAQNFSMESIDFAATPLSMGIDAPEISGMKEDMNTLVNAVGALNDGIKQLKDGLHEVSKGTLELSLGSKEFKAGLNELDKNSNELLSASASIKTALDTISAFIAAGGTEIATDLLGSLMKTVKQLPTELNAATGIFSSLNHMQRNAFSSLEEAINEIPNYNINYNALYTALRSDSGLTAELDKLMEYYAAAKNVKTVFASVNESFNLIEGGYDYVLTSINSISTQVSTVSYSEVQPLSGGDMISQIKELITGMMLLAGNYGQFHDGLSAYMGGVNALSKGYEELDAGVGALSDGLSEMYSGSKEISGGTNTLYKELLNFPQLMEKEIQNLMKQYDKSDFSPISFVSSKNTNVTAVQFAFKTAAIEYEAPIIPEPEPPAKLSFWQKLINLFRL
ncbi:MAG TPA: hypothetical protein VFC76_01405 [Oscillospiraceae bacterium]|nr:hypothetical protein [Oscillospiraceae bacterium]